VNTSATGTGPLIRLALRLDRVKLPIWILAFTALTAATASAFEGLYNTVAEREAFAATITSNPAFTALLGPIFDPTTTGGLTAWRIGSIFGVLAGLMGHQTVVRHTRLEEETGRLELLGAGVVGRHAPLAAALTTAWAAGAVAGLGCAGALIGLGQPVAGSVAFGAGLTGIVAMFAAVGAATAQMTTTSRAANGIAGGVVGTAFLLRAAGDAMGDGGSAWPSWISPIGWYQQLRPFADERWWVLGLMLAFTAVLTAAALAMAVRRDIDAGLLPTRPGPALADDGLSSPLALAWRLQRGMLLGWVVALAIWSAVIGSLARSVGDVFGANGNEQLTQIIEALGGAENIVDTYLSLVLSIVGLATAVYAMQAALRLRTEETALRAEPLLATRVRRTAWVGSHLAFALLGPALLLVVSGGAMGLVHGLRTGAAGAETLRLATSALAQLPATWVLAGIALALFGLAPRMTTAVWGVLVAYLLIGQLGPVLQLDQWVMNLSPFTHVPALPMADLTWAPLLWLTAVAAALMAAGLAGARRRDIA
jgi:ABC-2 type transport system permease protein